MKLAMVITAVATLVLALLLIYTAFGSENFLYAIIFFILGVGAIIAAIKYTVGIKAYGYMGLGDLFVFLFFGLVAVFGSYFLYALQLNWHVFLPAASIGFLSAGVLNLNNMRDQASDAKAGKNTLVVKMGPERARNYHYSLIIGAIAFLLFYSALTATAWNDLLYIIGIIPLVLHLYRVGRNESPVLLDPELKILALSTFAISILFAIGLAL